MPVILRNGQPIAGTLPGEGRNVVVRGRAVAGPNTDPGFLGGLQLGLSRNPITNFLLGQTDDVGFEMPPELRARMDRRFQGGALSDIGEVVGEFGPDLALGLGAFSLGRNVATRLVQQAALRFGGRVPSGFLGHQVDMIARGAQEAFQAGTRATVVGTPGLLRSAQIAGGAAGIGGLDTARALAEGEPVGEALQEGAVAALLVGGIEGALTGGLRISPAMRVRDLLKLEPALRESTRKVERSLVRKEARIPDLRNRLQRALGVDAQANELQAAAQAGRLVHEGEFLGTPLFAPSTGARFAKVEAARRIREEGLSEHAKKALRLLGKERAKIAGLRSYLAEEPVRQMIRRDTPLNPEGFRLALNSFLVKVAKSPETVGRELGLPGMKVTQLIATAESDAWVARNYARKKALEIKDQAASALGVSRKAAKDGRFLAPWVELYELGGMEAIQAQKPALVPVFQQIENHFLKRFSHLVRMGSEPALTHGDLQRLGLRAFFPQVVDFGKSNVRDAEEALARAIFRRNPRRGRPWAHDQAHQIMRRQLKGLRKFGSIDYQRSLSGTTLAKIGEGIPLVDDPIRALENYAVALERRIAYGKRFGFNGELRKDYIEAIVNGGGSRHLASSLLDAALTRNVGDEATTAFFNNVLNLQAGTKLTLAAIPNFFQPLNSVILNGMRRTLFGTRRAIRAVTGRPDPILEAVALEESIITAAKEGFLEPFSRSLTGRFASRMMTASGFTFTERMNRVVSGSAGFKTFVDDLSRASLGRLRGNSLNVARRRMAQLGFELDDLVRQVKRMKGSTAAEQLANFSATQVYQDGVLRAAFNSARATQFIPTPSRKPLLWQTPWGRVLFQFKTFAFGQARFLRDAVFHEASAGNLVPLAYFMSIYPMAGEVVGNLRSFLREKPREEDGLARYFQNIFFVGGLGIVTDLYLAAQFGRLQDALLGPTVSDLGEFSENFLRADVQAILDQVRRQPIVTTGRAVLRGGAFTADQITQYLDSRSQE